MNGIIMVPSPTRQYVIMVIEPKSSDQKENSCYFVKFNLPENYKNTCEQATWYFYNRLDSFSSGGSAFSFENYSDLKEI